MIVTLHLPPLHHRYTHVHRLLLQQDDLQDTSESSTAVLKAVQQMRAKKYCFSNQLLHGPSYELVHGASIELVHGETIELVHGASNELVHGAPIKLVHGASIKLVQGAIMKLALRHKH